MSGIRKVKTSPKMFVSDPKKLKKIVLKSLNRISDIVGATMGPGGRNVLIESDYPGMPNKSTKDGVTVFKALGSANSFEHVIIEHTRDAAQRTATEAGDGPQPLYAKVLTPRGFVEMKDLKEGSEICGTDETVQTVVGVYPKGVREIYEVELADHKIVECCADHLWSVTTLTGKTETKTTASLMEDYRKVKNGYPCHKYYLPITTVEFEENTKEMPLDPYLVGLLLGDGSLSGTGSIELSLGIKKKHVLDKIVLPNGIVATATLVENKNYYRVKISGSTPEGLYISDIVKSIGLFGTHSDTKFIPKSYLYSSVSSRKAVLQGLIDTDGHINNRGLFEYSTVSESLYEDFRTLTQSLGIVTFSYLMARKDETSYSNTPIYKFSELKGYKNGDKIVGIRPTGRFTEMQCIKVSNPNNLYITDNFVVTHNTTTSSVLSAAMVANLYDFSERNPKLSPQKIAREVSKVVRTDLVAAIQKKAIKIEFGKNEHLLKQVARISANGDEDMADAVIKAFELIGFSDSSHVTIKELTGPYGFDVSIIEGFPIAIGLEESMGKFFNVFVNDVANQRLYLEKPKFLLYDGHLSDLITLHGILEKFGETFTQGNTDYKNLIVMAHGFGDSVITHLSYNFANPETINVVPMLTPKVGFINAQTHFLQDLAAFTNGKVFGLKDSVAQAEIRDLGVADSFESSRFRSTVVGTPDEINVSVRVDQLKNQRKNPESIAEGMWLDERIGKLTNGIAKLTIYGGSNGELKENSDRAEDAVCSVRAAIQKGALAGGARTLIDLALMVENGDYPPHIKEVLTPSLMTPIVRILENAGYSDEEASGVIEKLIENPDLVYDVEKQVFGKAEDLGLYDSVPAVEEALKNATSIATIMGSIGGLICYPRNSQEELEEFEEQEHFRNAVENPDMFENEANDRI